MYRFGGLSSSVSVMTIMPLSKLGTLFISLSEHAGKLGKVSTMIINSINNNKWQKQHISTINIIHLFVKNK